MHLSQKQKSSSQLFPAFFKSILNLEHFKKNMTLIAQVFPKIRSPKNALR